MDFIFYEKPYVARNGTHFRVEHIYAQPRYILTSKDTQAGLAQWFKACTPVPKTAGSNPAADVLTILFSDNPWPFTFCHCRASECILSLVNPNLRSNEFPSFGVPLMSIPTKDKNAFPVDSPIGNFDLLGPFQKSTRKHTGGSYSNYFGVICRFSCRQPG